MGKMRQFRRAVRASAGRPLAYQLRDGYGASMVAMLEGMARGHRIHDTDIQEMIADGTMALSDEADNLRVKPFAGPTLIPTGQAGKAIAYLPVKGIAMYDLEFQPYAFSTLLLAQTVTALSNDPAIDSIVLDIASPGGHVTGTEEAADAIFAARKKKNCMALVNPLAASAAYWIASQATEIISVKSGDVGSIGVFMAHTDCSAWNEASGIKMTYIFAGPHKVEGNMDEPLSEEARSYFQSEVDAIYSKFLSAVAKGRGVDVATVMKDYGGGRTLMAPQAKKAGMVDDVATIDAAFARWGMIASPTKTRRGEAEAPQMEMQDFGGTKFTVLQDEKPTFVAMAEEIMAEAPPVEEPPAPEAAIDAQIRAEVDAAVDEITDAVAEATATREAEAETERKRLAEARARKLALLRA